MGFKPDLSGIYAPGAQCVGTNFSNSYMPRGDLSSANCTGAKFDGAERPYTKFNHTILTGATGVDDVKQATMQASAPKADTPQVQEVAAKQMQRARSSMRMGV